MAPKVASKSTAKRRRGPSEQAFYNDRAEELYHSHFENKVGIKERGLHTSYMDIQNNIAHRNWGKFTEQPIEPVLQIIREFYANARAQIEEKPEERQILVRGKKVSFDSGSINRVLQLTDIENDDYSAWVEQGPDYDEIIDTLAKPGSKWETQNDTVLSFPRGKLNFLSRGWHYFICARLMPTNHPSDVRRERAQLNFAIQQGLTINVGKIIEKSIIALLFGRRTTLLGHPSLIFELCLLARVPVHPNEEKQPLLPLINDTVMENLGRASDSRKQSQLDPDEAGPSHGRRKKIPGTSSTISAVDHIKVLQKKHTRFQKAVGTVLKSHSEQLDYLVDWTKVMTAMFQSGNLPHGCSVPTFPTPPTVLPFQFEEEEESVSEVSDSDE